MFLDFETLEASTSMSPSALGPPKLNGEQGYGFRVYGKPFLAFRESG